MASADLVGRKRPENCFRCWHCRRVDGLSSCCVCVANVTKKMKPEFIEEPYSGRCPQFWDKAIEEAKYYNSDSDQAPQRAKGEGEK